MATKKQKAIVEKYVSELQEVLGNYYYDKEVLHSEADELLLSAMIELGFQEVANAYIECKDNGFWYA